MHLRVEKSFWYPQSPSLMLFTHHEATVICTILEIENSSSFWGWGEGDDMFTRCLKNLIEFCYSLLDCSSVEVPYKSPCSWLVNIWQACRKPCLRLLFGTQSFSLSQSPWQLKVTFIFYRLTHLLLVNYGIYLHEFTNNEREISIPHKAASCSIENFEFIVSECHEIWIIKFFHL